MKEAEQILKALADNYEVWKDAGDGPNRGSKHILEWHIDGRVQVYVCYRGTLFDLETTNSAGDCAKCEESHEG